MNGEILTRYNNLLKVMARSLGLERAFDGNETFEEFSLRVLYSAIGHLAMASLFDPSKPPRSGESGNPVPKRTVSVVHFKQRIKRLYHSYMAMYPEIRSEFYSEGREGRDGAELLAWEILDLSIRVGAVYHRPHRLASPAVCGTKTTEQNSKAVLIRGGTPFRSIYRSGLGAYQKSGNYPGKRRLEPAAMFALGRMPLIDHWRQLVRDFPPKFPLEPSEGDCSYLNRGTKGHFMGGYYTDKIDKSGHISLLRRKILGGQYDYHLYRFHNDRIEISSSLAERYVEKGEHRRAANSCLAACGTLPAVSYYSSSKLVWLELGYLLPPAEQNLLLFYSWPAIFKVDETKRGKYWKSNPFHRTMARPVFEVIRKALEPIGFTFTPLSKRPVIYRSNNNE